ncbi:hypothetical protein GQ671_12280 [Salinicoccus hispanicus]|uniref:Uncharacterized protein n=1 Tax=Salinicoccus hispanicus TaxID=157225 RepID=A0A6N8U2R1_9STAP|nr:hypothetical protein [Salinicoccus hispanicus]
MKVEVQDYREEWIDMFEEEAQKIREIFGTVFADIQHIKLFVILLRGDL